MVNRTPLLCAPAGAALVRRPYERRSDCDGKRIGSISGAYEDLAASTAALLEHGVPGTDLAAARVRVYKVRLSNDPTVPSVFKT
jgi:hypothetical protein